MKHKKAANLSFTSFLSLWFLLQEAFSELSTRHKRWVETGINWCLSFLNKIGWCFFGTKEVCHSLVLNLSTIFSPQTIIESFHGPKYHCKFLYKCNTTVNNTLSVDDGCQKVKRWASDKVMPYCGVGEHCLKIHEHIIYDISASLQMFPAVVKPRETHNFIQVMVYLLACLQFL